MFLPRLRSAASVLLMAVALAFPAKLVWAQAEQAGLIPCPSHESSCCVDGDPLSGPESSHDSTHPCCASVPALATRPEVRFSTFPASGVEYVPRTGHLPDGAPRPIDIPPQLG